MPTPRRDPYVAVDATIRKSAKLAALPSDTARLGWIYVGLGEAKLQRPSGRFASRAHWDEVAGRFGKYLRDYLAACLLEEAPRLCDRCRQVWGAIPAGTLVVHDWKRHQTDPGAAERAAVYRAEGGNSVDIPADQTTNGARENADQTPNVRGTNADQTPIERNANGPSRARTRDPAGPRAANRNRRDEEEERINETVEVPVAPAPSASASNGLVDPVEEPEREREEAVPWV